MQNVKSVLIAAIIGISAVAAVAIGARGLENAVATGTEGFMNYKMASIGGITATGSASKDFESDLAIWSGSFSSDGLTTKEAYEIIKQDADIIKKYLLENGVKEDELTFNAVEITQKYHQDYNEYGNYIGDVFDGYKLTQRINVTSSDINKIEEISRNITSLIDYGVEFYPNAPEYYYTKLEELKLEMIEEATQNAKMRVDIIAQNSNSAVGQLLSANLGVFQITAQNSSTEEYSSGGVFNTWSRWKTASITVKLYYAVD